MQRIFIDALRLHKRRPTGDHTPGEKHKRSRRNSQGENSQKPIPAAPRIRRHAEVGHARLQARADFTLAHPGVEPGSDFLHPLCRLTRRTRRECFARSKGTHEFASDNVGTITRQVCVLRTRLGNPTEIEKCAENKNGKGTHALMVVTLWRRARERHLWSCWHDNATATAASCRIARMQAMLEGESNAHTGSPIESLGLG